MSGLEVLAIAGVGVVVGFIVGFLGVGASLLTVPALMLLLGLTATSATGTALIVVLTVALIVLVVGTGVFMWARTPRQVQPGRPVGRRIVLVGASLGLMTGTLGIGGGFLVVPALVGALGLPMVTAIGTSQLVLVVNATGGLVGRAGSGTVEVAVGLAFAVAGALGATVGGRLVGRWSDRGLTRAFALVLALVALALISDLVW